MIHISIPDTKLVIDKEGKNYFGFNVYCNGAYHSTVRYSTLLRLHESLASQWGEHGLPQFPPKKLRRILNTKQLEERKNGLNRYLQMIAQSSTAQSHPMVLKFFLETQIASFIGSEDKITLDILFGDLSLQAFTCPVPACTYDVINLLCSNLGILKENWQKFGLYIVRKIDSKRIKIIRWLKDFESPYISLQLANQKYATKHNIMIRKSCFEFSNESDMMKDKMAVHILYAQAFGDVTFRWCCVQADVLQRLRTFQKEKSYREYIKLCQLQKQYGYMHFDACKSDYPAPEINVEVAAGNRTLVLSYTCPKNGEPTESVFRVTRIRGWKLINQNSDLVFTFEYLISKDHFEWITLESDQSVLLSQCLQAMASDILHSRGSNQTADLPGPSNSTASENGYGNENRHRYESLPEVFSSQSTTNTRLSNKYSLGNGAFDLITDDDL